MSQRRSKHRQAPDRRSLWPHGPARLLLISSLMGTVAFFAVLPFGALYLAQATPYSNTTIGLIIGAISLVGALGGLIGGHLVDRCGAVPMLAIGLAASSAVYAGFMFVHEPALIAGLFVLLGVCRFLVEPALKHLMSSHSEDGRIFRLRYMTLCLGAVIGPVIGAALFHQGTMAFFASPAVLYGVFLLLVLVNARSLAPSVEDSTAAAHRPRSSAFGHAVRDGRLMAAVVAGTGIFFVFAQLETTIPLTMRPILGDRTTSLFATLLVINAVAALIFQPLADLLCTRLPRRTVTWLGAVAFAVAFGCFGQLEHGVGWLYLAVLFWTVGEGILLPMPDMAVHELASDDRKGVYFGLSELRYLGFFFGPVVGGALLDGHSGQAPTGYYLLMAAVVLITAPVLLRAFAPVRAPLHTVTPLAAPETEPAR